MDAAVFGEPRRRMIRLADGEMAALDFGDVSRPVDVVFLHANGFNAMTYRQLLGPLAGALRVLAVDQRGHGQSRLPADPRRLASWRAYRDDALQLLSTLRGPPPLLAGHSLGGTVALLTAAARPGAARGLLMLDPVILPPPVSALLQLRALSGIAAWRLPIARQAARRRAVFASPEAAFAAYRGRGGFRTWPDPVLADYLSTGLVTRDDGCVELACAPAWEAATFSAHSPGVLASAARLRAPVTVLKAERGSTAHVTARAFRGSAVPRVETVAGASHFLPMEQPGLVRDALLDLHEQTRP